MDSGIIRIPENLSAVQYASRKEAVQGRMVRMTRARKDLKRAREYQVRRATIRTVVYREFRRQGF